MRKSIVATRVVANSRRVERREWHYLNLAETESLREKLETYGWSVSISDTYEFAKVAKSAA